MVDSYLEQQIETVMRKGEAPCVFFSGIDSSCKKGYTSCPCEEHAPPEQAGVLGLGICCFETGKIVHLMKYIHSDGFFRRGTTWCERKVDEATDFTEIYPGKHAVDANKDVTCKHCLKKRSKHSD